MGANFLSGPPTTDYGGIASVPSAQNADLTDLQGSARRTDGTEYLIATIVVVSLGILVLMDKGGFKAMAAVNVGG